MTSPASSWSDRAVACYDPECVDEHGNRSVAEPEQDGDLHYNACLTCGYEFGYRRTTADLVAVAPNGTCSLGIPDDIRRAASSAMQQTLATTQPPLLQIGRRDAAPAA